jgi:serine/threonine protein phosphatase PrpC
MGNILELDHVTKKSTEEGSSGKFHYAVSGMKGWRLAMEDCHTVCNAIPIDGYDKPLDDHLLFAVYDGHGGHLTSEYAGENFVRILSKRPDLKSYVGLPPEGNKSRADVTGIDYLRNALKATFRELDREVRILQFRKNQEAANNAIIKARNESKFTDVSQTHPPNRKVERSGSTCIAVLITPSHIICANAGDSRAILRREGKAIPLSFDHKPSYLPELDRIISAGGFVKSKRIDGDLAVSRGLGDFTFKAQPELPNHKQKVIHDPDFLVYPRDERNDEFIVLACDGVWDVASNGQCSDMVQAILDEGETDISLVCEEVLDMCLERNSRDNMTLILVCFPGIKMDKLSKCSGSVVALRRASRRARILELHAKVAAENTARNMGMNLKLTSGNNSSKRDSSKAPPKQNDLQKPALQSAEPQFLRPAQMVP